MSHVLTLTPSYPEELVEGSLPSGETPEPLSPLRTGTMLVVNAARQGVPAAETGILTAVHTESLDDDESQDASRTTEEAQPVRMMRGEATKAPVILIVEDTTELAEVIQATLERVNMVTLHETHGTRALALLDEENPDLVLLDISLPDMTGWKILDVIKEKHDQRKIQMPIVIVITAYGDPANRLVGKLQGIHSYLIKPFTSDEVEQAVVDALRGADSEGEDAPVG